MRDYGRSRTLGLLRIKAKPADCWGAAAGAAIAVARRTAFELGTHYPHCRRLGLRHSERWSLVQKRVRPPAKVWESKGVLDADNNVGRRCRPKDDGGCRLLDVDRGEVIETATGSSRVVTNGLV